MKPIVKLKDQARVHEQREEWEQAIQLYLQVLRAGDEREGEAELGVYNRVGDLYLRLGRQEEAVRYYEQAADRYAESGFYNNAIALCSKALRYMPGRSELYLRLGQFSAAQGFMVDARRWFLEYAEQMLRAGEEGKAFKALHELADTASDPEVRELLARQLVAHDRREEALVEYRRAYRERVAAGQLAESEALRPEILELDPGADLSAESVAPEPGAEPAAESEAASLPVTEVGGPATDVADGLALVSAAGAAGIGDVEEADEEEAPPLPLLYTGDELGEPGGATAEEPAAAEPFAEEPRGDEPASVEPDPWQAEATEPGLTEPARSGPEADAAETLERARELAAQGRAEEAVEELDAAQRRLADAGHLVAALRLVDEAVRLAPDHVRAQQDRVEYAFRLELHDRLVGDYLDLAASLERAGALDRASSIYHRVLDLDPENETARAALAQEPSANGPWVAPADDFVDLGDMLRADELMPEETTRFVVPEEEPTGDEEQDFAEMLTQFKEKLAEHVPADDLASHYDLGLAFKEMGLVDEAIAQFQTALRAGRVPLKVYEELGHCFVLKEQYNVAIKVLSRALQAPHEDDSELLGVFYHLGRCYEELGRAEEARDAYERVFGVDINFRDVADRLARL